MKKIKNLLFLPLFAMTFFACKKEEISIPTMVSEFATESYVASYFIQNDPNSVFKIPIGITSASSSPRTITYTVSSPTGAVAGAQYTLATNTITIPAGKVLDSIAVKGIFAGYPTGRKDTLVFTITGGDVPVSIYGAKYTLVLQKYCNVTFASYSGAYVAQDYYQNQPDGSAYSLTLTPGASTGTTGVMTVTGLWGIPNPFTVNFDWSNPANFTTTVPDQNWFMHPTYGQVKIRAAGVGTFSSCDNTFLIRYEAYVPNLGSFGVYYTTLRK